MTILLKLISFIFIVSLNDILTYNLIINSLCTQLMKSNNIENVNIL